MTDLISTTVLMGTDMDCVVIAEEAQPKNIVAEIQVSGDSTVKIWQRSGSIEFSFTAWVFIRTKIDEMIARKQRTIG